MSVDASVVVKTLFDQIMGRPYPMPITYDRVDIGVTIPHFALAIGDTSMFLQILQQLSEFQPGFDYWVGPMNRKLKLAAPYRFGDPVDVVTDGATGSLIKYIFTDDATLLAEPNAYRPLGLDFTNTGPEGTHILATGSGYAGTTLGVALGLNTNEAVFWRTDSLYDAGEIKNKDVLEAMGRKQFGLGLQPVHEIPVTLDPNYIDGFWTTLRAGGAIWIKLDLGFHQVDSPQRVVRISGSLDPEGNCTVTLDNNQIYDTDPSAGDYEG
jgi:hypothetical protein